MISIYEEAGGDEGLTRLARAWHNRVLADPIVGHAFEHGFHPDHTRRLGAYWAEALGGPARYTQALGSESMVVRMHSGNGVHTDMDERAIECFEQALVDTGITHEPLRTALLDYFVWATNSMTLYPDSPDDAPSGLEIPLWSWDGPIARVMSTTKQRDVVEQYFQGFRLSDHSLILATLTDDVVWVIHGHRETHGTAEFDSEIENPAFVGSPELDILRVLEDGNVVVAIGEGRGESIEHGPFRFAFNDLFTFRDDRIARVDSYVVPLP
jgi:hemoglobin